MLHSRWNTAGRCSAPNCMSHCGCNAPECVLSSEPPVGQISTSYRRIRFPAYASSGRLEVDVVMRAIDAQIGAVGIIFVVTHATVTGDAAVHFVMNGPRSGCGRARLRWLSSDGNCAPSSRSYPEDGSYRHCTDRTVVRVVSHQPLHHAFTGTVSFFVVNRDKGTVGGWRHTGHHRGDHAYLPRFGIASPHTGGKHRRFPAPGASKNTEYQGPGRTCL